MSVRKGTVMKFIHWIVQILQYSYYHCFLTEVLQSCKANLKDLCMLKTFASLLRDIWLKFLSFKQNIVSP